MGGGEGYVSVKECFLMEKKIKGSIIWSSNGLVIRQSSFWQAKTSNWHLLSFHPVLIIYCKTIIKPCAGHSWAPSTCQFHLNGFCSLHFVHLKCLLTKDVSYFPRRNKNPRHCKGEKSLKNSSFMDTTDNINSRQETSETNYSAPSKETRETPLTQLQAGFS